MQVSNYDINDDFASFLKHLTHLLLLLRKAPWKFPTLKIPMTNNKRDKATLCVSNSYLATSPGSSEPGDERAIQRLLCSFKAA